MAFHPYPHLIPALFNVRGFGPPFYFTKTSPWTWIAHLVSGLRHATKALLRLAFAQAPCLQHLASPHNVTRRSVLQKVRGHRLNLLPLFVSARFQVLFHSPPGVLFTFPSRYWFTIGRRTVLSLGGWSPLFPAGFLVSRGTWEISLHSTPAFRLRGFHPVPRPFPEASARHALNADLCGDPLTVPQPPWCNDHSLSHTTGLG